MCTLSWWITESQRGVFFNRDELRTRTHGLPPRLITTESGKKILMPLDPDAGGTWIGVNEEGLIVAVLNNYPHYQNSINGQRSRGQLVVDLLSQSNSAEACMEALECLSLKKYRGFLLFAMDRFAEPLARSWDGGSLATLTLGGVGGMHTLTTSSVRHEDCRDFRHALLGDPRRERTLLYEKHSYFHFEDSALGPVMVRADAATDSITEITLHAEKAQMQFQTVRESPAVIGQADSTSLSLKA
jgi:hypothetical protein